VPLKNFLVSPIAKYHFDVQRSAVQDGTEKPIDNPPEKKTEMVYMDKISGNEDDNSRSDRRLYAKLY